MLRRSHVQTLAYSRLYCPGDGRAHFLCVHCQLYVDELPSVQNLLASSLNHLGLDRRDQTYALCPSDLLLEVGTGTVDLAV